MQVLDGIRVLDLSTGPVGGMATATLADFGADVVKVEPPGGDRFRALAASPLWLRGKRSVVLDLAHGADLERLQSLVAGSDVLVVAGPPDRAARWGVDADRLIGSDGSDGNAGLVHCSITPWGPRGPYRDLPGYDALVAAKSGRMMAFAPQLLEARPVFAALPVHGLACAMGAVQGITAALLERERTGRSQRVETSLLQGLLPYDLVQLLMFQLAERGETWLPVFAAEDMPTLNYHPILSRDGRWIQCGNLLEHLFFSFLEAIELLEEMFQEPRFQVPPAEWDEETIEAARDRILLRVRERTADEWMQIFRDNGNVAAEPYWTTQEALGHPDLVANGDVVVIDDPARGKITQIGTIARLGSTPGRPARPAPAIGEHTEEVLAEPRRRRSVSAGREREPAPPGRPLAGTLVVDFSTIIAAPLGSTLLADLGARVIKVETVDGDPYRGLLDRGLLAVKTNSGKESIALDLKSPAGREIAHELIRRADVVLHNLRTGVPDRLGIGYEQCKELRPDIIWVAVHGYGPDGPSVRRPATHPVVGAVMGGAGLQAGPALRRSCERLEEIRETSRQLMRANEANPDPNTSVVVAAATLLALLARERHGEGQRLDVSMLVANAWANADDFLAYSGKPARHELDDHLLGFGPGYRLYRTRSGWVVLTLTSEAEWVRFAAAAGHPELEAAANRTGEALEAIFAERDADDWERLLVAEGVGCVRADAAAPGLFWAHDPQVEANGLAPASRHLRFGDVKRWGPLVTVGGPAPAYGPGALSGDHTDALLAELGYEPERIAQLRKERVVASEPVEVEDAVEPA